MSNHLSEHYNKAKHYQQYPASLKLADVTSIHKKDEKTLTKNYRPINLIPVVSKIFEKNMHKEIMDFIGNSLSPYLFGFTLCYYFSRVLIFASRKKMHFAGIYFRESILIFC